jgi:hypothetical protein
MISFLSEGEGEERTRRFRTHCPSIVFAGRGGKRQAMCQCIFARQQGADFARKLWSGK